jgi:hypothetical protein
MENPLIQRWARYLKINFYHAAADLDAMEAGMGKEYTREYTARKMNLESISLNAFCAEKGIIVDWYKFL